ncbi:MAG: response regulator transcription factor [Chitinophagaceae bacterium]|nr:response regulator transcription factor [Chitinophagaceae bacterium]MBK7680678.1 response regulator transcription factor [Chitinophagaceae bacterium]MBK9465026.1 response regulator transcription factor [Chitinophagaceae bacterium]MBK9660241.1 response regulator transcription factor [Chitinophagaceae bacterium]MBK9939678.1 response regulator transcription factor [Chitinophagaceae bacterium]
METTLYYFYAIMNFIIALTEDNSVNRNTFLQKISMLDNMQLAFIASNGHECLEQLKGVPEGKRPQVIFMDLEMPHMNGIETISLAKSLYPEIHFVVLTVFDDDEKIFEAIKAGASGYLLKHEPAAVLQEAVMNVLEFGGAPMSPAIARKALQLMSKASLAVSVEEKNSLPEMITTREEEILKHMVNGWDAKRIASVLDISVLTVRKHIANIYDKLHVQSRAEVINMAHHNKWFNT